MKALFNRFNRGLSKDKDKYSSSESPASSNKEKLPELPPLRQWPPERVTSTPNSFQSTKPLPDLTARPLPPIEAPPPITLSDSLTSSNSSKAHESAPVVRPTPPEDERNKLGLTTVTVTRTASPRQEPDTTGRSSRKTTNDTVASTSDAQHHKKVAFLSRSPTPATLEPQTLDAAVVGSDATKTNTMPPLKTTVSRFQAAHGSDARGSTSTASSSKVNVNPKGTSAKSTSTRTAISPNGQKHLGDNASLHPSLRSGTPYSQNSQSTSRILATASWSEAAEEDLVSNIGPRERTRQEVLWEIVASEERYVTELLKLKETFIEPLLHPYATSPVSSPTLAEHDDRVDHYNYRIDSPRESIDHLPIASRFLSPLGFRSDTPATVTHPPSTKDGTPNIDGESFDTQDDEAQDQVGKSYAENGFTSQRKQGNAASANAAAKFNHPRSPYNTPASKSGAAKGENNAVPFPSRSHQSLPPPSRGQQHAAASTPSLGRQSFVGSPADQGGTALSTDSHAPQHPDRKSTSTPASRMLRKFKRSTTTPADLTINGAISPHQLPEDLRKCLEVLEGGIFGGHVILSESLRKRYDDEYPLVRSLADVFVANSHILHEYATYVLHLERALEQVDDAMSTANDPKRSKKQDNAEWVKVCKFLLKLEENAAEKGETGLAISLSKPFQRLLKYPLLFQNLLYHTDPSTFEYESTLQMVSEVETIVRSIEDEKIQKEERDKTRDAFARIDGLEKVKQLALPKPSRLLVEERVLPTSAMPSNGGSPASKASSPPPTSAKNVKGKNSFRRLSDVLQPGGSGVGGKKDLWLVEFNDVVLRCQRTGVTSLPLASSTNSRTNSLPDLQAKAKYATTGRKGAHTKPRNLYKFIRIENWAFGDVVQPRQGVVTMEEVVRSRAQVHSGVPSGPPADPEEEQDEDGNESDESDRKSKMSFSYWGADKVTIHKPAVKARQNGTSGLRKGATTPSSYARESSANAKFGSRLIHQDGPHHHHNRPASRRTQATPISRRTNQSEDSHSAARSTVTTTRPAWDGSTRAAPTVSTTPVPQKRTRLLSGENKLQTGGVAPRTSSKSLASPAPSEDSGVGLYRQLMAADSTLNRDHE